MLLRGIGLVLVGLAFSVQAETVWKAPEAAAKVKSPVSADSKTITNGRTVYEQRCADCHGKSGKGDGPGSTDLEKPATNFRKGRSLDQTDGELFWKITEGHRPMPSYKKKLSDEERWQVVHYLRTFAETTNPHHPNAP
jgi:mono/diheme cytochrome c family protein